MTLREFWRFHFLKALLGLVALQLIIIAIIQNYNHKPIAVRDEVSVVENRELKIKPLTNDTDKDDDTEFTIAQVNNPLNGSIKQKGTSIFYTPNKDFVGVDSLSYTASDGKKESKPTYILINVKENMPATANNDAAVVYATNKVSINAISNDDDAEGDSIYIKDFTQPLHGKLALENGIFIYAASNKAVTDSFTYTVADIKSVSKQATVVITVKSKNDACYPWLNSDIGNIALEGKTSCSDKKFTIEASGSDIWESRDGFHFVYQAASGDCEIVTMVESMDANHEWAKAGIMIRESLTGGSPNVYTGMSNEHGGGFQCRFGQNEGSNGLGGKEDIKPPYWFKLKREGNKFTSFTSIDGNSWEEMGSQEVNMSNDVYIGLCSTSHNNGEISKAVFSGVRVK